MKRVPVKELVTKTMPCKVYGFDWKYIIQHLQTEFSGNDYITFIEKLFVWLSGY